MNDFDKYAAQCNRIANERVRAALGAAVSGNAQQNGLGTTIYTGADMGGAEADKVSYWVSTASPAMPPDAWSWGSITGASGESGESPKSIRQSATQAEHARILAILETCRPTEQPYSRIEWRWEEKGAQRLWDKIMKALGVAE